MGSIARADNWPGQALGEPVFNLLVRDEFIGWDVRLRELRLASVLDAYVAGPSRLTHSY